MPKSTDSNYLSRCQYRDSSNLSIRANLHHKYSTSSINWHQWVLEQLNLSIGARVLELGCGPGYLWRENTQSLTFSWRIFLSDLSEGMLEEAREALGGNSCISYTLLDAQDISFPEGLFDAVIANHMLYHMSDLSRTFDEIKRVLKSGGCLYAATNGRDHLTEFRSWKTEYFQKELNSIWDNPAESFGLENGENQLLRWFSKVNLLSYPDQLSVTDVDPIIRYLKSWADIDLPPDKEAGFRLFLEEKLKSEGVINITKATGLFKCEV